MAELRLQNLAHSYTRTPSGPGAHFKLVGLAGSAASLEEGVELNLVGRNFGLDPTSLSFKLPVLGRLGAYPDTSPKHLARDDQ